MKLTYAERWMLANQHRILAKLEPQERRFHETKAEALERGYELEYHRHAQISDDGDAFSVDECREVYDILDMFRALKHAMDDLAEKPDVPQHTVEFHGFDANNEKQFGYARFLKDQGLWEELNWGDSGNSHCPVIEPYRLMLAEWKRSKQKHRLTKEDVIRISSAYGYGE